MSPYRIKIVQEDLDKLRCLVNAKYPKEAAAFALAGVSIRGDDVTVLVRRPIEIPPEQYVYQTKHHLKISTQAINGLSALCEKNQLGVILCHSHPNEIPYSASDDFGEGRIVEVLRQFIPANAPTASVLFCPGGFRARIWMPGSTIPTPISELVIVGRHLQRIRLEEHRKVQEAVPEIYDRQVRALGEDGQRLIAKTKVGIVGVGGTGSPTAEQLVRLGVRDLVLIDPDIFEPSNVTRVYGAFAPSGLRQILKVLKGPPSKVGLVRRHLRRINPAISVRIIMQNVVVRNAVDQLLDRDIIMLCTDDHWGRSIVNRLAYQYLIPVVNMGVRIDAHEGSITGAVGTADILRPGTPCLWCKGALQAERIATESIPKIARRDRVRQGYVQDLETPAPSVVSMTTVVSGLSVSLFLQLATDFMGENGEVARLNYHPLQSTVGRGMTEIQDKCICRQVKAFGDLKDLPLQEDLSYLDG
jgi:molybdopterin/thiamine biosynthesis adenylyltransferase